MLDELKWPSLEARFCFSSTTVLCFFEKDKYLTPAHSSKINRLKL